MEQFESPAAQAVESRPYMVRERELRLEEAIDILLNPDTERVITVPPSMPSAGEVYVYVIENVKPEITKIRSDGYKWNTCSGKVLRLNDFRVQKYYWTMADHQIKRHEFRLVFYPTDRSRELVLITHYLKDQAAQGLRVNEIATATAAIEQVEPSLSIPGANERRGSTNQYSESRRRRFVDSNQDQFATRSGQPNNKTPPSQTGALSQHKRPARRLLSPLHGESARKLSKNQLLGQQIEVTLDTLKGDELIAARDEIYDFLRKWDKD